MERATQLPGGTVTFLFTDVEGSTRLLHELGDGYAEVLAEHRRVLREAFARHGGVEVDTQGDAFFVAFGKASEALAAASEARSALQEGPIRVRIGVHTGEPLVTEEGYVGIDVHRAARIAAAGHGGQILVSQSTRDLVGAGLLRDLGEHRLKDLTAAERIYQLGDADFPPLKSLNATNLPVATNPLVGRERELDDLLGLLRDSARLVTLTGAGGSGKTRLGLQVASELTEEFRGGVFFVPLAGVGSPDLVESAVAGTIGVRKLDDLRDRNALLVVDNFEHVLEAAPVVARLLSSAPDTKVLATSRAPLRLDGEREYPVDPLPDGEAVELLTQRARAVRPDFEPDEATRAICIRLDGLPLALELAASRLRSLGTEALLERLDQRLPVLTSSRRDAPERQRTLRATIEWSYDLLTPELQDVFGRLAVFAGSFSLEAAEAVLDATLDQVDALVEASLLKALAGDRFLMLETIREFATERADLDLVRRRHAEYFLSVACSANLMNESEGEQRHDIPIRDRDNFRAALVWTVDTNEIELGLRIVVALENYWAASAPEEGLKWSEQLLAHAPEFPGELMAQALRVKGGVALITADYEEGRRNYELALEEYRRIGDQRGVGIMLLRLAVEARRRNDLGLARSLSEEGLRIHRAVGFVRGEAQALSVLGGLDLREGNEDEGFALLKESAELSRKSGFSWWYIVVQLGLAHRLLERSRTEEAEAAALDTIPLIKQMDDRLHAFFALALLGRIALSRGRLARAGRIWGAIEREEAAGNLGQWADDREELAGELATCSEPDFELGLDEGRRFTLDEALDYALSDDD
jgi:predicted ATPase